MICDIESFQHPGICNSIKMDYVLGREIDRYFYGGYDLEQLPGKQQFYHTITSSRKWFTERKIGELDQSKMKLLELNGEAVKTVSGLEFQIDSHEY